MRNRAGSTRSVAAAAAVVAALSTFPAGAAGAAQSKVLRYAFEIAETGFDPAQISDLYSREVAANIFEAPLSYSWLGPAGTLEPRTAESLPEVSADFRSFTFTIRPGIYFADDPAFGGRRRELVAADYVFSIKRMADPRWHSESWSTVEDKRIVGLEALRDEALKSGHFNYDRPIAGLQALDRYRFRIVTEEARPRLPEMLGEPSNFGAVAREVVEHYGDRIMEHPVGTGPYRLGQWRRSSLIVLERNPDYREELYPEAPPGAADGMAALAAKFKGRRLPMIDRIEIAPIEESQPRWLAFLNGEQDLLRLMPRDLVPLALTGTQPTPLIERKGIQVVRQLDNDVTMAVYNLQDPVIGGYSAQKVALRRALNLGIDVDRIIALIYQYQGFPAQAFTLTSTYGFDPDLHTENGDYDPARANALLDLYGYRPGPDGYRTLPDGGPLDLEMTMEPDQQRRLLGEILQKNFDALGVRLHFRFGKWPENLKQVEKGQYQIWFLGYTAASPDNQDGFRLFYGPALDSYNLSRMLLPEFDRQFIELSKLPNGPERLEVARRMTAILMAYAPGRPMVHRYRVELAYPWVLGYMHRPFLSDWYRYLDIDGSRRPGAGP
jgi:ABC-type transport system substrate-binding protein